MRAGTVVREIICKLEILFYFVHIPRNDRRNCIVECGSCATCNVPHAAQMGGDIICLSLARSKSRLGWGVRVQLHYPSVRMHVLRQLLLLSNVACCLCRSSYVWCNYVHSQNRRLFASLSLSRSTRVWVQVCPSVWVCVCAGLSVGGCLWAV